MTSNCILGCLFACLFIVFVGCEKEEQSLPHSLLEKSKQFENKTFVIRDVIYSYRNYDQQLLDLYYRKEWIDKAEKVPILLYVTGGGWVSGSKDDWMLNHVRFADSLGMISIAINYRLAKLHPMQVDDVAHAIRWIKDNISYVGGDPDKIYIMGASAGALLVDLVALDKSILSRVGLDNRIIKGVISIDGGAYLTLDPVEYILPPINHPLYPAYKELKDAYQLAFGSNIEDNYKACPYYLVENHEKLPPFLFISQGIKVINRYKPNKMMYEKLIDNGFEAFHFIAQDYNHTQIFKCIGTSEDQIGISNSIEQFIKKRKEYDGK